MATTDGVPPINSPKWWDEYLQHHWDGNGGAEQTRHFMQRLIAELPAPERDHLRHRVASILDWGCAHGEGVDELARAFGGVDVRGLDIAPSAVEEARRRFPACTFALATDGAIPRADVVVSSNCLEHFHAPWQVAERLAAAAKDLLILLVPCDEAPLCESHVVAFGESSFPERIGGLLQVAIKRIGMDPRCWGGDQLLAIYGSEDYVARREPAVDADAERAKWDRHYATVELEEQTPVMARFAAEFAHAVAGLLPAGGRVLEAGAGAGWHSLALARTGNYELTVLDFSEHALRHARAHFAAAGRNATFVLGDAREHGEAEYDLVFNSGVLEHFQPSEQTAILRAMASRSRNLVLALVPNRQCYWYWVWRVQAAARGDWPFGQEMPPTDLAATFANAGMRVLGERVFGQDWTESFLDYLEGVGPELRSSLLAVHRSPLLVPAARGYLSGVVGAVADGAAVDAAWDSPGTTAVGSQDPALIGALADALALHVRLQGEQTRLEGARQQAERTAADAAERFRRHLDDALVDNARLMREHAAEVGLLQERLLAAQTTVAANAADEARLRAQLADAARDGEAREREHAHLQAQLRDATTELARVRGELEDRRRAHEQLQAWQSVIEGSLSFRLLRRLDRLRGGGRAR